MKNPLFFPQRLGKAISQHPDDSTGKSRVTNSSQVMTDAVQRLAFLWSLAAPEVLSALPGPRD